jgi:hypothetical protein
LARLSGGRLGRLAGLLAALALAQQPAQAVLGEPVSSVHSDQMRMQGVRRTSVALRYEVHEIRMADGAFVRQFASPAGQVFALTWRSPLKLQLQPLLGQYFANYQQAIQQASTGRGFSRQSHVQASDLVVTESAAMGLFSGQAYVQSLVPGGVDVRALR